MTEDTGYSCPLLSDVIKSKTCAEMLFMPKVVTQCIGIDKNYMLGNFMNKTPSSSVSALQSVLLICLT